MSIELAIKARIPIIAATCTDTVNLSEVLRALCGKALTRYKNGTKIASPGFFYYSDQAPLKNPEVIYRECVAHKSCLIVINQFDEVPGSYAVGPLPLPAKLLNDFLLEYMDEDKAQEIIPALGGLTLQEVTEILMLTQAREGYVDSESIIASRLSSIQRSNGLDIVSTELQGYFPDSRLKHLVVSEKTFFLGDHDMRLRPRGLLATGSAGTGKSSGAKYVAREWGVPLFRLDATVQSKWLGESESNLKNALQQIEQAAPAVLLLDETEKFFAKSNDGGATQKLLGSMLWWLQEHKAKVFTFMTTNSMQDIPPELYRRGRIDNVLEFKVPPEPYETAKAILASFNYDIDVGSQLKRALQEGPLSQAAIHSIVVQAIKDKIRADKPFRKIVLKRNRK